MLDKYKVDAKSDNFALFVVRDNGGKKNCNSLGSWNWDLYAIIFSSVIFNLYLFSEQRRLKDDEYPLEVRVVLGPHENVARLFLVDKLSTPEISSDVAQFLNLSVAECHGILQRYHYEEERQILLLKEKWVYK